VQLGNTLVYYRGYKNTEPAGSCTGVLVMYHQHPWLLHWDRNYNDTSPAGGYADE
jgi:hypothetical protein